MVRYVFSENIVAMTGKGTVTLIPAGAEVEGPATLPLRGTVKVVWDEPHSNAHLAAGTGRERGAPTGLVAIHRRAIGSTDDREFVSDEIFDPGVPEALRATGRQSVEEAGEWATKFRRTVKSCHVKTRHCLKTRL